VGSPASPADETTGARESSVFRARNVASTSVSCMYLSHSCEAVGTVRLVVADTLLPEFPPLLLRFFGRPHQQLSGLFLHRHLIKIGHLRMRSQNAAYTHMNLVPILQPAGLDLFLQDLQRLLHPSTGLGHGSGIVSEANLTAIRKRDGQYLVGTPRSRMKEFERQLSEEGNWE
jgi:hypothetical protein